MNTNDATLDMALDEFRANPCHKTATSLIFIANAYMEDEILSRKSFDAIAREVKAYQKRNR